MSAESGPITIAPPEYRLWVSPTRCTLIRMWNNGTVEVCTRPEPDAIWGPPTVVIEETL